MGETITLREVVELHPVINELLGHENMEENRWRMHYQLALRDLCKSIIKCPGLDFDFAMIDVEITIRVARAYKRWTSTRFGSTKHDVMVTKVDAIEKYLDIHCRKCGWRGTIEGYEMHLPEYGWNRTEELRKVHVIGISGGSVFTRFGEQALSIPLSAFILPSHDTIVVGEDIEILLKYWFASKSTVNELLQLVFE